jgi:hypothetical protein
VERAVVVAKDLEKVMMLKQLERFKGSNPVSISIALNSGYDNKVLPSFLFSHLRLFSSWNDTTFWGAQCALGTMARSEQNRKKRGKLQFKGK